MAAFDDTKAYAPQEETFFDDGREIRLLHAVYSRPDINKLRGSPAKVLAAIDDFGRQSYLMNVGQDKGAIVAKLIAEVKPKVMVELGGYVGYSAILFGNAVREAGGQRYYCLERNPEFAAVVSSLVDLAGLGSIVKVVVGSSSDSIRRLHAEGLEQIDFLFLDHYKPAYLPDLKLCEQLGLIRDQTVLAADNVIKPGNPPYLEYVRSSVEEKRQGTAVQSSVHGIGERHVRQYPKSPSVDKMDCEIRGNPNLIYSSQLIESFEPTGVPDGVEITRCVGTAV
ncbi:hypothetical protein CDD81_6401 [Ophiocordyceps australis]|uniref:catechol O-methyltransferase n=1 Tax=Ophiocordyceps australis TaxID=1399860 RepID=A0A2C5Y5K9_9HYPO|nr:hypothetical protein CDD81_6401 [Ophiocordyceps australis]